MESKKSCCLCIFDDHTAPHSLWYWYSEEYSSVLFFVLECFLFSCFSTDLAFMNFLRTPTKLSVFLNKADSCKCWTQWVHNFSLFFLGILSFIPKPLISWVCLESSGHKFFWLTGRNSHILKKRPSNIMFIHNYMEVRAAKFFSQWIHQLLAWANHLPRKSTLLVVCCGICEEAAMVQSLGLAINPFTQRS